MEMKIPRWMAGVMRLDRICNEDIRNWFGVVAISDNFANLVCDGTAEEGRIRKVCLDLESPGKLPKSRPKQRWLHTLHNDLELTEIHPEQARDRAKCVYRTSKADPATRWDNR
ncbi:hypothetical protein ANCDUO_01721 [Ancylostoma duodenale]|uniref:Uncharacterized protein n=1 Tax=Ancylostoma duodenale TaxID=51022 RepID=A0A0C2DY85_9BILA|nr:hypothetical protein ANCDUO_01721 [Ancylostoma duodenale]